MSQRNHDAPLSGVLRVVYFLAVAIAGVLVAITGVISLYEPPSGDTIAGVTSSASSREGYDRNVSLILAAIAAGVFAFAILALGSRFNPLRAGLLLGGLIIYLIGIGFWASASDRWLGFLMSIVVFGLLPGLYVWLEDGLPLRYLERRPDVVAVVAMPIPPPPPPPPPPSSFGQPPPGPPAGPPE